MATKLEWVALGENLFVAQDGDETLLRFNHKYRGGKSTSGKTVRVASSEGNHRLPHLPAVKVGVNAYESAAE